MNFKQFIIILRARLGIVLFAFLITVGTTAVITYYMPRTYTSLIIVYPHQAFGTK